MCTVQCRKTRAIIVTLKQTLELLDLLLLEHSFFESTGDVHMIEADVLLRGGKGGNGDPIMAHPPETDSDNTLQEWLKEIVNTDKGIKLDFKRYLKTKRFLYCLHSY